MSEVRSSLSNTLRQVEDQRAIAEVLAGRREAFDGLVIRYLGPVQGYFRGFGCASDQVDDLLQEVFIRAFRYLGSYQPPRPFLGWLLGIARNVRCDLKPSLCVLIDPDSLTEQVAGGPLIEETAVARSEVESILAVFCASDKLIIELRLFQDLTYGDIGILIEQTEAYVRVRFHRILARLRIIVQERRSMEHHD